MNRKDDDKNNKANNSNNFVLLFVPIFKEQANSEEKKSNNKSMEENHFFSKHPLIEATKNEGDRVNLLTEQISSMVPEKIKHLFGKVAEQFGNGGCSSADGSSYSSSASFVIVVISILVIVAVLGAVGWTVRKLSGRSDEMPLCFDIFFNSLDPNEYTTKFSPQNCDSRSGVVTSDIDGSRWSFDSTLQKFKRLFNPKETFAPQAFSGDDIFDNDSGTGDGNCTLARIENLNSKSSFGSDDPNDSISTTIQPIECSKKINVLYVNKVGDFWKWDPVQQRYFLWKTAKCDAAFIRNSTDPNQTTTTTSITTPPPIFDPPGCEKQVGTFYKSEDGIIWNWNGQKYVKEMIDKCPNFVKVYGSLDPVSPSAIFDPSNCNKSQSVVYLTSDGSEWRWDGIRYKRIKAPTCPAVVLVKGNTDPNAPSATFVPSYCSRNSGVSFVTDDGAKWGWNGYRYSRLQTSPTCSNVVNVSGTNDPNFGHPVFNPPFCPTNPSFVYRTSDGAEWRWDGTKYYQTKAPDCPSAVKITSSDPNNPATCFDPNYCARTFGSKYIGTDGSNWVWDGNRYTCSSPASCPPKVYIDGTNDPNQFVAIFSPSHCARMKDTIYAAPDGSQYKWDGTTYQQVNPPNCPLRVYVPNSDDPNSTSPAPPVFNPSYCGKNILAEYLTPNGSVWKYDASVGRYFMKTPPKCPSEVRIINSNNPNNAGSIFDPPNCARKSPNDASGSPVSKYLAPDGSEWIWDGSIYKQIKAPLCPSDQVSFTGTNDPNTGIPKFNPPGCEKDLSKNPDLLFVAPNGSKWKWNPGTLGYVMVRPADCPAVVSVVGTMDPNQNKGPASFSPSHCQQQPSSSTTYSTADGAEFQWDGTKYQQTKPPSCPSTVRVTNVNDPNSYGSMFDPYYCAAKAGGTSYIAPDGSQWAWNPTSNTYIMTKPADCPATVTVAGVNNPNMSDSTTSFTPGHCQKNAKVADYKMPDGSSWRWDPTQQKYIMTQPPTCQSKTVKVNNSTDPNLPSAVFDPPYCAKLSPPVLYLPTDGSQWAWNPTSQSYIMQAPPPCPATVSFTGTNDPNVSTTGVTFQPSYCQKNPTPVYAGPDGSQWKWDPNQQKYYMTVPPTCPATVTVSNANDPNMPGAAFQPPYCQRNPSTAYAAPDGSKWKWDGIKYVQTKGPDCPTVVQVTSATDNNPNNKGSTFSPANCAANTIPVYKTPDGAEWKFDGSSYQQTKPPNCPANVNVMNVNDPNVFGAVFQPSYCQKNSAPVYKAPDGSEWKWNPATSKYDMTKPPDCPASVTVTNVGDPNTFGAVFQPAYCQKNPVPVYKPLDGSQWKWDPNQQKYIMTKNPDCPTSVNVTNASDPNSPGAVFQPSYCQQNTVPVYKPTDGSEWRWDPSQSRYIMTKPPDCTSSSVPVTGANDPNAGVAVFSPPYCQKNTVPTYTPPDGSQWKWDPNQQKYTMTKNPDCPLSVSVSNGNDPNSVGAVFNPYFCQKSTAPTYLPSDGSQWKWDPNQQKYVMTKPPDCTSTSVPVTGSNDPNTSGAVFSPSYCQKNSTPTYKPPDGSEWKWDPNQQRYIMTKPPDCSSPTVSVTGVDGDPNTPGAVFNPPNCEKNARPIFQLPNGSEWKWDPSQQKYIMTKPPSCPSSVTVLGTDNPNNSSKAIFRPDYCKTDPKLTYIADDTSEWKWDPNQQAYIMTKPPVCPDPMPVYESTDPNLSTTVFKPPNCARNPIPTYKASDGSEWKYDSAGNKYNRTKGPDTVCPSVVYVDSNRPAPGVKHTPNGCLERKDTTYKATDCSEWIWNGTTYTNTKNSCLDKTAWLRLSSIVPPKRVSGELPSFNADGSIALNKLINVVIVTTGEFNMDWTNTGKPGHYEAAALDPAHYFNTRLNCYVMSKPLDGRTMAFFGSRQTDFTIDFSSPVEGIVFAFKSMGTKESPRTVKLSVDINVMGGTSDFQRTGPGTLYGAGGGGVAKLAGRTQKVTGQISATRNPDHIHVTFFQLGISACGRIDPLAGYMQTIGCLGQVDVTGFNDPNDPNIDFGNFSDPKCRNDPDSTFVTPDGRSWIWTGSEYVLEDTTSSQVFGCDDPDVPVTSDGDPNLPSTTIQPRQCYKDPNATVVSNTGVEYQFDPSTGRYEVTFDPDDPCNDASSDGNPNINDIDPPECAEDSNYTVYDTVNDVDWEWDGTSYQQI